MHDPKGYYARLGVGVEASAAQIHAAFRARAKVLHPDVPGTGDAAAFVRLTEAYRTLGETLARDAYDRAGRLARFQAANPTRATSRGRAGGSGSGPAQAWRPSAPAMPDLESAFPPEPPPPAPKVMWVRPSRLVAVAVGLVLLGGLAGAAWQFSRPQPARNSGLTGGQAAALIAQQDAANQRRLPDPGRADPDDAGTPHYIQPLRQPVQLFRYDRGVGRYLPAFALEPFTPVALLRLVPREGLVEIRLPDRSTGFVSPYTLVPGDAAAAERARCIDQAGAPPRSGEIFSWPDRRLPPASEAGDGSEGWDLENRSDQPVMLALSGPDGAAAIYLAPHAAMHARGLPTRADRAEYAQGDLWSRACFRFMAGMRTLRLMPGQVTSPLSVPVNTARDVAEGSFAR